MTQKIQMSLPNLQETGLLSLGRPSVAGLSCDKKKLNGQVYTPLFLAEYMLNLAGWPESPDTGILLDPACGDGVFLEAAIRKLMRLDLSIQTREEIIGKRMHGWDIDPIALDACRKRLKTFLKKECPGISVVPNLQLQNALLSGNKEKYDCIIGNPPYLEAKRMPDNLKQLIRKICPLGSRGAFDLYTAFIDRALQLLKTESGEICFLIPNRFLVTAYAEPLRRELLKNFDVNILDLSTEKVFDDAAVYPIVLKATAPVSVPNYRVISDQNDDPGAALESKILLEQFDGAMPLPPSDPTGQKLLYRIISDPGFSPVRHYADIRWTVSFHRAGLRDRYIFDSIPSGIPNARQFLGGKPFSGNREVQAYRIEWDGLWIDYDEKRAKSDSNPFPSIRLFDSPKLVICQNSRRARAAIDHNDLILKDTFLSLKTLRNEQGLLEWLCLVINSDIFHFLYEHMYAGTRKSGKHLHFMPRYILPLPVPPVPDALHVSELEHDLSKNIDRHEEAENLVRSAYEISRKENKYLELYDFPEH